MCVTYIIMEDGGGGIDMKYIMKLQRAEKYGNLGPVSI